MDTVCCNFQLRIHLTYNLYKTLLILVANNILEANNTQFLIISTDFIQHNIAALFSENYEPLYYLNFIFKTVDMEASLHFCIMMLYF